MRPRRGWLGRARWATAVLTAALLVVWFLSYRNVPRTLVGGYVGVAAFEGYASGGIALGPVGKAPLAIPADEFLEGALPWLVGFAGRENWGVPRGELEGNACWVVVPIWQPTTLLAISTLGLWFLDRSRAQPNHCRGCGYNLAGNVSGVCPECGARVTDQL